MQFELIPDRLKVVEKQRSIMQDRIIRMIEKEYPLRGHTETVVEHFVRRLGVLRVHCPNDIISGTPILIEHQVINFSDRDVRRRVVICPCQITLRDHRDLYYPFVEPYYAVISALNFMRSCAHSYKVARDYLDHDVQDQ